jgi:hypothetical protein
MLSSFVRLHNLIFNHSISSVKQGTHRRQEEKSGSPFDVAMVDIYRQRLNST